MWVDADIQNNGETHDFSNFIVWALSIRWKEKTKYKKQLDNKLEQNIPMKKNFNNLKLNKHFNTVIINSRCPKI